MNTASVFIMVTSSRGQASDEFEITATQQSTLERAIKEMKKGLKSSGLKGLKMVEPSR
jgi:hypothetical protein